MISYGTENDVPSGKALKNGHLRLPCSANASWRMCGQRCRELRWHNNKPNNHREEYRMQCRLWALSGASNGSLHIQRDCRRPKTNPTLLTKFVCKKTPKGVRCVVAVCCCCFKSTRPIVSSLHSFPHE